MIKRMIVGIKLSYMLKTKNLYENSYWVVWQIFSTPGAINKSHVIKSRVDWLLAKLTAEFVKKIPIPTFLGCSKELDPKAENEGVLDAYI